jgi:hypothetical protein
MDRRRKKEIDERVRQLQLTILQSQEELSPGSGIENPIRLLKAPVWSHFLAVEYSEVAGLEKFWRGGIYYQTLGIADPEERVIAVEYGQPPETRRFTAAHELAHLELHNVCGLHRDRAIFAPGDRNSPSTPREVEANYFAAAFLVPRKLLRRECERRFGNLPLVLTDETAYWLTQNNSNLIFNSEDRVKAFAFCAASATSFDGRHFKSLSEFFEVSCSVVAYALINRQFILPCE